MIIMYTMEYIKGIWYAIRNKPVTIVTEQVVQVPFTAADINRLEQVFKTCTYVPDQVSIEQVAYTAGQVSVVEYMKRIKT